MLIPNFASSGDSGITQLTGDVTAGPGSGSQSVTLSTAAVLAKTLTGYVSGAGTVSASDSILTAIQKLNGNTALKADSGANSDITSMTGITGSLSSPTFVHYKQTATPATPAATFNNLYFKSDDKLYKLNSAGTEAEVGAGSSQWTISIISASQAVTSGNTYLLHANSAAISLTLPTPATGSFIKFKDIDGGASTNNITIVRNAGEKIEGLAASKVFSTNFINHVLVADGTDWWIFY